MTKRTKKSGYILGVLPTFAGASPLSMVLLILMTLIASMIEGVGAVLVYPILEVMRTGQDLVSLSQQSVIFEYIVRISDSLHVPATLEVLMVSVALLIILRQVFTYVVNVSRGRFSNRAVTYLSSQLFESIVSTDIHFIEQQRSGSLINALTTEAKRAGLLAMAALNVVTSLAKLAIFVMFMLFLSWQATLGGLMILSVVGIASKKGFRRSMGAGSELADANDSLSRFVVERVRLLRLMKMAGTQDTETSLFQQKATVVETLSTSLVRDNSRVGASLEPIGVVVALLILYVASRVLNMGLSEVGVFVLILFRLMPVMKELSSNLQQMASYQASLDRISELIERAETQQENLDGHVAFPCPLRNGIRLDNVSYAYPVVDGDEQPVLALKNISLFLPAGRTIALLGPSGAGKSTLIDLLPRLKIPNDGTIHFDDVLASDIPLGDLRANIAMVSQDILVVDGTVEENLRYGNPQATLEDIQRAARDAFAEDFILRLPQGYDTVLGERGARLSGGQRQRIALARALLARVPVLLLDEPTSALDAESEQAVQQALERQQRQHGTTIVIIAHRLSTVSHADLTVVLDNGALLGVGTHDELIRTTPWYQKVVELQS
ncbi:ABC transporter ATP-binding protein [Insolitispirillum peregrinum]|uniref:ATP-binding cassette, subfamily B/ATP-binding cassette, subfamily B, MsbA n=1 Tax=Insolitispirillum peregrinum TaxID=80876 RepID=A0A1N7JPF2_9PROT|nr:ABC transporter ATP-binding protein [Insolitispirillum peregrinum]SIS51218.1 ATP-binding cassette, subfamily B/ATP-binding cassette, subfamily B, MsbA [Insolitispirillum peregrinum]